MPPLLRLVRLERDGETCPEIEVEDLPKAHCLTLLRLGSQSCVAYCAGKVLYIYDYKKKVLRHRLTDHSANIVAIDARDISQVATLSADGTVKVWNASADSGVCIDVAEVGAPASYFLGYPYHVCMYDRRVLVSADQGVFLVELDRRGEA
mmetsp:Transcript_76980/g.222577  ORF Transcript_76980/g.222577 Transcript_76980/m.222577 type:complete len:150 (-) Transcript_76980:43-492(-)